MLGQSEYINARHCDYCTVRLSLYCFTGTHYEHQLYTLESHRSYTLTVMQTMITSGLTDITMGTNSEWINIRSVQLLWVLPLKIPLIIISKWLYHMLNNALQT